MSPRDVFDIEDALVTKENPALDGDSLDYERCARLHNYLVAYGWMAQHEGEKPDVTELASHTQQLRLQHEDAYDQIHSRLHPSLNHFLDSAYESTKELFYWVSGLDMVSADDFIMELFDETRLEGMERFIVIYNTVVDLGSHCVGLIYDQKLHRATLALTLENLDSVFPIEEHEEMWWPLESILSHWVQLIRMGKVIGHGDEGSTPEEVRLTRSQIGTWSMMSYCQKQVDDTIAAIDRYTAAIEARIPSESLLPLSRDTPLFTDEDLDAASIPKNCFIRSLLTRIKTPRFTMIAPGLAVPHDKQEFINRQKFITSRNLDSETIPSVLIFASADTSRTMHFNDEIRYLFFEAKEDSDIPFSKNESIPTGLYSEAVQRSVHDQEAGFRLVLPFPLRSDYGKDRARKSDGSLVGPGSFTDLFQHGFFAFGGEWRAQRLERLIDRWTEMIETGIWTVGVDGVEGSIDKFQDADRGCWKDYWIAPSW